MPAGCGPRCSSSCERCDRVGCSLRMSLASALSERIKCSLTWRRKATPAGRSWWVLTTSEPRTDASEFGLWPTPLEAMARSGLLWATPNASGEMTGTNRGGAQGRVGKKRPLLGTQVKWLTRVSSEDGPQDQEKTNTSGKRRDWPTPDSHAGKRGGNQNIAAQTWRRRTVTINDRVLAESGRRSGKLSPDWVGQLMGAPDNWLATNPPADALGLKLGETPSSRKSLRKSGRRS